MNGNRWGWSVIGRFITRRRRHDTVANLRGNLPAMRAGVSAALLLGLLSLPAFGQVADGLVGGITRDSASGKPVSEVQIVAHNLDRNTDQWTAWQPDLLKDRATLGAGIMVRF
jgi:hypothetical protein